MRAASTLLFISTLLGFATGYGQQPATQPRLSRHTGRELMRTAPVIPAAASESAPAPEAAHFAAAAKPLSAVQAPNFPGFSVAPRYGGGDASSSYADYVVVAGEFDGKPGVDLGMVQGGGTINLFLNDGAGNFTPVYGKAPATYISAVTGDGGDFNGDGLTDLVVANNYGTATAGVYINQGGGQFAAPVMLPIVQPPGVLGSQIVGSMRVGDVNNDGHPDIVFPVSYVNYDTNESVIVVSTYLGDGRGNFAAPVITSFALSSIVFSNGSHSVELADMAHTGKLSLILQATYSPSGSYATNIFVAKGNGDGTFGPLVSPGPPIPATVLTHGTLNVYDFDGDGNLDVLFADGVKNLQLALGNGDGTLKPYTVAVTDVGQTTGLVAGDLNHDGILDVVAFQAGLAMVFNGTGGGAFSYTPSGQYIGGLAFNPFVPAVDLNGDGNLDFVWFENFFNQASVFFGNGDSTFRGAPAVTASSSNAGSLNASVRANNLAVIMGARYASKTRSDVLVDLGGQVDYGVFEGNSGALKMSTAFNSSTLRDVDYVEPLVADLNGDGYADPVMATLTGVKVSLSNGDGTFGPLQRTTLPLQLGCVLGFGGAGDLNGDGKTDLAFGYTGNSYCGVSGTTPSGYVVLLGDGKGSFTSSTFVPYGNATGTVRLADFNGDGVLDLAVLDFGYSSYSLTILRGIGDGTFDIAHPVTVYSDAQYAVNDLQALDMDRDGKIDIVMTYYGADGTQAVQFLKGNGDFTFAAPASIISGATGQYLEVADFNGDGLPDVALTLTNTSSRSLHDIAISLNTGNGTFAAPLIYVMPTDPDDDYNQNLFAGDFNGDGALDLIAGNGNFNVPGALFLSNAGSTWTLSAQPSSPTLGSPVQLIAQASTPTATLLGTVQFLNNGQSVGSATVNNNAAVLSTPSLPVGTNTITAVLSTPSLPVGTNTITAQYSGDSSHFSTIFGPVTVLVQSPPPAFSMSASPTVLYVINGSTGPATLNIATNAGFQGTITFACSNLPANTTCTINPQSLTLGASATQTVGLTVTTAGSSAFHRIHPFGTTGGIAAATLVFFPFAFLKRRMFGALACTLLLFTVMGCAGSKNTTGPTTTFITVTATATVASGSQITQAVSVPLTVL